MGKFEFFESRKSVLFKSADIMLCFECLELHGVSTGLGCLGYHLLGNAEVSFMVVADLRNNENAVVCLDVADFHAW